MRQILCSLATLAVCCSLATVPVTAAEPESELEELREEVERLRGLLPGQAFAMTQVAYNASNLYAAVQAENWPLATFYLNETRVRLRWAIRLTPVRRLANGEIELTPLATALETTQLAALEGVLAAKDKAAFTQGYDELLNACQACHVASEKPFLRLIPPSLPAETLINFQP